MWVKVRTAQGSRFDGQLGIVERVAHGTIFVRLNLTQSVLPFGRTELI